MANRNRAVRRQERAEQRCKAQGHDWSSRVEHHNDPFNGSPHLPGGLVGWSQYCRRCGCTTGRGDY